MKKLKKVRIDALLLARGLAENLKEAQVMVIAGEVSVDQQRVDKPSAEVSPEAIIAVKAKRKFVSRGGDKMANALALLKLGDEFIEKTVLDIGASTGGFTDMLLSVGAAKVVALDVGTNQLAWKLRQDPRVVAVEKTDIRTADLSNFGPFDWIVADISFNSLSRLAEAIWQAGSTGTRYLLLVKPQFELPRAAIPRGGVVVDPEQRQLAVAQAIAALTDVGFTFCAQAELEVPGRKGNFEVMLYLRRS